MTRLLTRMLAASVVLVSLAPITTSPVRAQSAVATPSAPAAIPDSPAGRVLKAWLDAFNSADVAKMDAYYQKYEPGKSAENLIPFWSATGGFDLLAIEKSDPLHIEFRVKERKSETNAIGALDITAADGIVKVFNLLGIPKGGRVGGWKIDAAARARVMGCEYHRNGKPV